MIQYRPCDTRSAIISNIHANKSALRRVQRRAAELIRSSNTSEDCMSSASPGWIRLFPRLRFKTPRLDLPKPQVTFPSPLGWILSQRNAPVPSRPPRQALASVTDANHAQRHQYSNSNQLPRSQLSICRQITAEEVKTQPSCCRAKRYDSSSVCLRTRNGARQKTSSPMFSYRSVNTSFPSVLLYRIFALSLVFTYSSQRLPSSFLPSHDFSIFTS